MCVIKLGQWHTIMVVGTINAYHMIPTLGFTPGNSSDSIKTICISYLFHILQQQPKIASAGFHHIKGSLDKQEQLSPMEPFDMFIYYQCYLPGWPKSVSNVFGAVGNYHVGKFVKYHKKLDIRAAYIWQIKKV